jgi:hypothetical protein
MSRFSTVSRETAGQVLLLTRQGISLLTLLAIHEYRYLEWTLRPCVRIVPACRHADGTIS